MRKETLVTLERLLVCATMLLSVTIGETAAAGEKKIVLTEHLNRLWVGEFVSYPFEAEQGQCAPQSLRLTGPAGPRPAQLSEVQFWPGTKTVQSANLSFIVEDLPPLSSQTYTVTYAPDGAGAVPASDLKVVPGDSSVEATTSRFGARFLFGEKVYEKPLPAAEVSGPLLALRLADGTWFGGSRLYGKTAIKSWSAKITDNGPVFLRAEVTYTYADGNTLTVAFQLRAGDYALLSETQVKADSADDGWELLLNKGVAIPDGVKLFGMRSEAREQPVSFTPSAVEPACYLSPWSGDDCFPDGPTVIRLKLAGRLEELHLSVRDAGAWVRPDPAPRWQNFNTWGDGEPDSFWSGWQNKRIPLIPSEGGVLLRLNLLAGQRKWSLGANADGKHLWETFQHRTTGDYTPFARLNEVKDMILDWPDGRKKHPFLYLSGEELKAAGKRYDALTIAQDLNLLRKQLDSLGNLDLFRICLEIATRYDMLIDSPEIAPAERKLFKAQMAYLGYMMADPNHWSFERGCIFGNPNMSVARVIDLGIIGFALRDNPQSRQWITYALDWAKYWLREVVDDQGYWPESSHYARFSWSEFVQLALVARNAGEYDFFADPKFKAMTLFYEKTLTPPDPLRVVANATPSGVKAPNPRIDPPYGRGTSGDAWGVSGLIARATATSDPAFSRLMQWSWRESGYAGYFGNFSRAGLNQLYVNRDLPAECPDWRSEFFTPLGYLLRSRVGRADENYLLFVSQYPRYRDGEKWPGDTGSIAKWFAGGKPIGGSFSRRGEVAHPMMQCRVVLATNWDPAKGQKSPDSWYVTSATQDAFAPLPGAEYVSVGFTITDIRNVYGFLNLRDNYPAFPPREQAGVPPLYWQRQLLLVGNEPGGPLDYLVLRDSVAGKQPTSWHFWTLSEKVGTAREAAERTAFLADKPGAKPAPLRELSGDRFTALGQFGIDTEYYIAAPTGTPRHTLRYGLRSGAYGMDGGFEFDEYQDLLYLQLPGDGTYFVALFPHAPDQPSPDFSTLGNGTVIKVSGIFGTDYCFLSKVATSAAAEEAAFEGCAAVVRNRTSGLSLQLNAPGKVSYRDYSLSASLPASLSVTPYALTLTLSSAAASQLTLRAPGIWAVQQAGVTLSQKAETLTLEVPASTRTVTLTSAK